MAKNRWGPVLGSVVLVKATAYGMALIIMTAISYRNAGVIDPFIPLGITLTFGCAIALLLLLRNIGDQ